MFGFSPKFKPVWILVKTQTQCLNQNKQEFGVQAKSSQEKTLETTTSKSCLSLQEDSDQMF